MKIKWYKYNWDEANRVMIFLEELGYLDVSIIGSCFKKGHSNKDIDILLAHHEYSEELARKLMIHFRTRVYQITDWGSLFLPNTLFGTLDIFFKGQTDDFDF